MLINVEKDAATRTINVEKDAATRTNTGKTEKETRPNQPARDQPARDQPAREPSPPPPSLSGLFTMIIIILFIRAISYFTFASGGIIPNIKAKFTGIPTLELSVACFAIVLTSVYLP